MLIDISISLTPDQESWLVARGDFPSVADAVRRLIDDRITKEGDGLAWAKPNVDEAIAAVARGEVVTREAHRQRTAARLASFRD